jgi:hypothetical protein
MASQRDGALPWWIRALLAVGNASKLVEEVITVAHEETVLGWVPPRLRNDVTFSIYRRDAAASLPEAGFVPHAQQRVHHRNPRIAA